MQTPFFQIPRATPGKLWLRSVGCLLPQIGGGCQRTGGANKEGLQQVCDERRIIHA